MNNDRSNRVNRGGSWYNHARAAPGLYRALAIPSSRDDVSGFRLSRIVNPLEQLSEVADGHC